MITTDIKRIINIIYIYSLRYITKKINVFKWKWLNSSNNQKLKYTSWILERSYNKSNNFVPLSENSIILNKEMPKLVAFYLPQYYETDINNINFGRGFTEWYNVSKAIPQYTGHNQPQLPIDVGFYNLAHDDVMYRQIELAKQYGIQGFCFYYYWFSGVKQLDKPIENFMNNKSLNMPFCFMWANAPWSREWGDGNIKQILIKQEILPEYDELFAKDLIRYFKDNRYIKINNKPVLIIFRVKAVETDRMRSLIDKIQEIAKNSGFDGVYVLGTNAGYFHGGTEDLGIEGIVEFGRRRLHFRRP